MLHTRSINPDDVPDLLKPLMTCWARVSRDIRDLVDEKDRCERKHGVSFEKTAAYNQKHDILSSLLTRIRSSIDSNLNWCFTPDLGYQTAEAQITEQARSFNEEMSSYQLNEKRNPICRDDNI